MEDGSRMKKQPDGAYRGIEKMADGTYLALTFSQSRTFKTLKGAKNWMSRRMPKLVN